MTLLNLELSPTNIVLFDTVFGWVELSRDGDDSLHVTLYPPDFAPNRDESGNLHITPQEP